MMSNEELKDLVGGGNVSFTRDEVVVQGLTIAQVTALDLVGLVDADDDEQWDIVEDAVRAGFHTWLEAHDNALLESYGLKKATLPKEFDME